MASAATADTKGRPQHSHMGSVIGWKDARQSSQIGIRLAVASACAQIRHGAGKSTAANASSVRAKITEALLTEGYREKLL
jgi:hypothetical protein